MIEIDTEIKEADDRQGINTFKLVVCNCETEGDDGAMCLQKLKVIMKKTSPCVVNDHIGIVSTYMLTIWTKENGVENNHDTNGQTKWPEMDGL